MRRLSEVDFDIETITREMAKLVIAQSDMDGQLKHWDKRRENLEKERQLILQAQREDEAGC